MVLAEHVAEGLELAALRDVGVLGIQHGSENLLRVSCDLFECFVCLNRVSVTGLACEGKRGWAGVMHSTAHLMIHELAGELELERAGGDYRVVLGVTRVDGIVHNCKGVTAELGTVAGVIGKEFPEHKLVHEMVPRLTIGRDEHPAHLGHVALYRAVHHVEREVERTIVGEVITGAGGLGPDALDGLVAALEEGLDARTVDLGGLGEALQGFLQWSVCFQRRHVRVEELSQCGLPLLSLV